jgi:hypothetical protein
VTDNETDPDNPAPGLEFAATDVPMHYMFEIQLMTNQNVGNSTEEKRIKFDWMAKKQHVRSYLINYYAKHEVLPTGPCYLGMTRPLNLEIGMVDLGAIRQKIRADCVNWNGMNSESLEVIGDLPDYPMDSEVETGMQEQAEGRDPNETIFDLRQELTRRGKKI